MSLFTLSLTGPSGSGKTAAVFALAAELGFNVLEVNASSGRNGKAMLARLHEATQSQQVRREQGKVKEEGAVRRRRLSSSLRISTLSLTTSTTDSMVQ